jgi:replicative superfamily II helicase
MMSDNNDFEPEEAWDEYVWERFLQEQDRNTEKYFKLLETYMDHPNRDEIIAEEMGWSVFEAAEEAAETDEEFETPEFVLEDENEGDDEFEEFTQSPVYADTLRLHKWINRLFDSREDLREHPEALRFATRSAICGAKLAAALCGQEQTEIGMTIAYLKRALKAANDALEAAQILGDTGVLDRRRANHGRRLVFSIRNRVVDHMREYRRLWSERHGN